MQRYRSIHAASAALLLLVASAPAVLAQGKNAVVQKVTLQQAVSRALSDNALLGAARADVDAKKGRLKEAKSYFIPNFTLTENASRTDNPVYVFMDKLTQERFSMSDFQIDRLNNPAPLTNYQTRVEMTWPLFTGGKLKAAYRAGKLGVQAAQNTAAFAESQVREGVTKAFYGALLANRAVSVMKEAVKTAKAHRDQVEALYKQGLVLDSDLLRIKVYVSDMEQKEAERKADLDAARAYLGYAMGMDSDAAPDGALKNPSSPLPVLARAQKAALLNRGDLEAMRLQHQQAQQGVKMARAAYLPDVGVMAAYEWDTESWNQIGNNWMVGLQIRLPLFDGGLRAGKLQTAHAQELQVAKGLLDLEQKIRVQVKEAWLKARAAEQRVAVTEDSVKQAKENQRIVALRYKENLATITDLLDADMTLTAAKLTRAKAIHDALLQRARLRWAVGSR
ncbi:MAG: TolC family protein [Acidobacteriota bacterium]